jgi:hypothetical protein
MQTAFFLEGKGKMEAVSIQKELEIKEKKSKNNLTAYKARVYYDFYDNRNHKK